MSGGELELVKDVFESNWIAPLGPHVDAFEKEFAKYIGVKHALAVSSGTAAMHLVARILGIGRGDRVLCSTFTFCGSVTPVIYQGAEPVFVDSDLTSWNMDPTLLEKELAMCRRSGKMPKAVIAVHLYGQSSDMKRIMEISGRYGVPVIEDAAESLGADYMGRKTGSFGLASIFSFNGNKIITTSGGGMLVSDDKNLIEKARYYAAQARDPFPYYHHTEIGYNYRMSNVLAAIGLGQMRVIEKRVKRKREIFEKYKELLASVDGISFMPEPEWSKSNRWLTCVVVDKNKFGASNEDIRLELEKYNIESRPLWKPMHLQPVFKKYRILGGKVSKYLFENGLCLPSGTAMTDEEIKFVCRLIKKLQKGK